MQKYTLVPLLLIVVVFSFFLYGSNSSVQAITVPTPILKSPGNQSNPIIPDSGIIVLDWYSVDVGLTGDAEKYEVEVIKEPSIETYNDGGVIEYRKKGSPQTFNFTVTNSVSQLLLSSSNLGKNISHGDIYRWRVRACSLNCIFNEIGPWSEQRTFITKFKNPTLTEPLNGRLVLFSPSNPVKFTWNGVASAEQYELNLVDTATGVNAITPTSTSGKEKKLDFSDFAYLIQKTFSWTIEPFVSGEREDYFSALQNLYPSDNIPSKSISASGNFTIRFMPPTEPIFPEHEAEVSETSSITLEWDPILDDPSKNTIYQNTKYQVKKPDGTEEFVSSNTLAISAGGLCELQTWEVRSCNENGTNCGPYPSHASIKNAYPLDAVELGPWEFTVVPEFSVSDFNVKPYFDSTGKQGEKGDVKITATITISSSAVIINFGDGTSEQVTLSGGNFEVRHIYSRSKTYTISISVKEGCGTPYEEDIDIDIDPPRVRSFDVSPKSPDWVVNKNNPDIKISWEVSDAGRSNLKQVEVWRAEFVKDKCDDESKDKCGWGNAIATFTAPGDLSNPNSWICSDCATVFTPVGVYWYGIHVFDNFGNMVTEGTKGPIKVQLDTTSPNPTSIDLDEGSDSGFSDIDNITNDTTPTIVGKRAEGGDNIQIYHIPPGEGQSSILVGEVKGEGSFENNEWSITLRNQLEGEHIYTAITVDAAGNESSSSEELIITIDITAPQCEISANPASGIDSLNVVLSNSISEGIQSYLWESGNNQNSTEEKPEFTYGVDIYTPKLTVTDFAGNKETCVFENIVVDSSDKDVSSEQNSAPSIVEVLFPRSPSSYFVGTSVIFQVKVTDPDNDSLQLFIYKNREGLNIWCSNEYSSLSVIQCSSDQITAGDIGSNPYYVQVCDPSKKCSNRTQGFFSVIFLPPDRSIEDTGTGDDGTPPEPVISATPGECRLYCEKLSIDDAIFPPSGITCICNPLSSIKFSDIFGRIVNFLLNIALVVAPIALVASGFMFITAGGNPEQIIRARSIIIWTVVGVIVILLSKGLMNVLGGIIGI